MPGKKTFQISPPPTDTKHRKEIEIRCKVADKSCDKKNQLTFWFCSWKTPAKHRAAGFSGSLEFSSCFVIWWQLLRSILSRNMAGNTHNLPAGEERQLQTWK